MVNAGVTAIPGAVALEDVAVFLQFTGIVVDQLIGSCVGLIFLRYHFQSEKAGRDIDVGALVIALVFLFHQLGAGINAQSDRMGIGLFAYVNAADGSVDVDFLLGILAVFLHVDT